MAGDRMASIETKPVLIYDGDCGFCEKTARLVEAWTGGRVHVQPWQKMSSRLCILGLTSEDVVTQVWFVHPSGLLTGGAEAMNNAMRYCWWARPFSYLYYLPGLRQIENRIYRWIARNR